MHAVVKTAERGNERWRKYDLEHFLWAPSMEIVAPDGICSSHIFTYRRQSSTSSNSAACAFRAATSHMWTAEGHTHKSKTNFVGLQQALNIESKFSYIDNIFIWTRLICVLFDAFYFLEAVSVLFDFTYYFCVIYFTSSQWALGLNFNDFMISVMCYY